ncbi:copper transporter [Jatrophihabitans sp. YIM 134969]
MISFRYHVVSIVAVFLALALGIVVGTTALNGPITDDLRNRVDAANKSTKNLQQQLDTAQSTNSDANAFVEQFGPLIVKDALKDKKVLVVVLPGSGSAQDDIAKEVTSAGGTIAGTITMTNDFFSTARAADITSLVTNGTQPSDLRLPATDDAVALGGALLAFVLTGKGTETELATTVSAFASLQMLEVADTAQPTPTDLVAFVGTGAPSDAKVGTSEATFVSAFQQAGAKTVVAGDSASNATPGLVATIRADDTLDKTISTVDNSGTAMGRISTVLALTEGAQVGSYGIGTNADSPYPKLTS